MNRFQRFIQCSTILLMVLMLSAPAFSASHAKDEVTAEEVQKEAAEAYKALEKYSADQRDEAVAAAQKRVDKLDKKIEKFQERVDKKWDKMTAAAQAESRKALENLRERRNDLAQELSAFQDSSADAWEELKKGFADSFGVLAESIKKAEHEFRGMDDSSDSSQKK